MTAILHMVPIVEVGVVIRASGMGSVIGQAS